MLPDTETKVEAKAETGPQLHTNATIPATNVRG